MSGQTLVLSLSDREHAVLAELAAAKGMSPANLLRQALRLYQCVDDHAGRGEQMAFTRNGALIREPLWGLRAAD